VTKTATTTTRRGLGASVLGAMVLAGAGPAGAMLRWQAASGWPEGNLHTRSLRGFIEQVRAESGDTLQIQLHSGGDLLRSGEVRQAVQSGQVQMGDILLGAATPRDPAFELDSIPMLVRNLEQARRLAALSRPWVEQRLQRDGLTLLYWLPWPGLGLFSSFWVDSLDGLRGTRMRALTPMGERLADLAGAMSARIEREDLPQAFATRLATTMIASPVTGGELEAWRFAKFFTTLSSGFPKNVVCVQSRALEALPPPRRQLLREVAERCERQGWDGLPAEGAAALQVLIEHGMTVRPPSPKLVSDMERVGAIMSEEWVGRAGPQGQRLLDAYRER